jgi:hypothetical protein
MTDNQIKEVSNYLTDTLGFEDNGLNGFVRKVNGFYIKYRSFGLLDIRDAVTYDIRASFMAPTVEEARKILAQYIDLPALEEGRGDSASQTTERTTGPAARYLILNHDTEENFSDLREAVDFAIYHQPCVVLTRIYQKAEPDDAAISEIMLADNKITLIRGDCAAVDYIYDNYPDLD